jgi:hypothetical protein
MSPIWGSTARRIDWLTDWLTVGHNVTLALTYYSILKTEAAVPPKCRLHDATSHSLCEYGYTVQMIRPWEPEGRGSQGSATPPWDFGKNQIWKTN